MEELADEGEAELKRISAEQLRDFEKLVLSQRPATVPWEPVTDYSFEARKAIEGQHPRLILDTFHPVRVLDYGCWQGHLIRLLEDEQPTWAHSFQGYEPSPGPQRYSIFQQIPDNVTPFDLVICREVLEHLTVRDISRTAVHLCALSTRFVYVTTRFAKAPQSLLDVETSDDLDPTHISMLNQDLLRVLFVLEGFKRRADLEETMDWQHKGRVLVYERAA